MSATTASALLANAPAKLPRWANTLLVMIIGWALAVLSLKLLPQAEPVHTASTSVVAPSAERAPDPMQLAAAIANVHLFGDANAAPVVQKEKPKQTVAKETKLNLQLAGVFAYTPENKAIAIISSGGEDQNAYGIGDKVSGETVLKEVHKTHVILSNRGKLEKLSLPENVQPIAMRPVQQASSNGNAGGAQTDTGQNAGPVELPATPGALRDTLARNPSMLGRIVAAEPYQENGKLLGYRITPKQNPEILEAQGIIAGDVITRVNNIQLNSQKQGIRALRNAVKAETLEVVILRDGVEVPITISLAQ